MTPLRRLAGTRTGQRLLHDPQFRSYVSVCAGMTCNLAYAAFRMVTGILHASVWLISSAVYFLLLGILRAALAISYRRLAGTDRELCCYRAAAWCLLVLNLVMSGMMLQTVRGGTAGSYPGVTIYASAAYTTWMMTHAAVQLRKSRRLNSPILSASKAVSFTAALMSVYGLQGALIAQFSGEDESFRVTMSILTGAGIFAAVTVISLVMLLKGRRNAAA